MPKSQHVKKSTRAVTAPGSQLGDGDGSVAGYGDRCGDQAPLHVCECVKPETHQTMNHITAWKLLTDAEIRDARHRCAHGREWV